MSELTDLVDLWWDSINDLTRVLDHVTETQWSEPTDLPGWDVRAVVAHLAHLEHLLAGGEHDDIDIGSPEHVTGALGTFTEQGVLARAHRTPDELVNELRASTTARRTTLLEDPPTDPDAPAPGVFGVIGWSTRTLLRNRPLDVWMHEQDIRRAINRPGGLDSRAARHTVSYLAESLPYVIAKRAGCAPGTSVVVDVEGHGWFAAEVGADGRGALIEVPSKPTTRLRMDTETFIVLAGGRRQPDAGEVQIEGDVQTGQQVLDAMAVTP